MNTETDPKTLEMSDRMDALGNPSRLRIFKALIKAGTDGANVGSLQEEVDIPASTLTHHIQRLVKAGLVVQSRKSRELICRAEYGVMDNLIKYLTDECCQGLELTKRKDRSS